MDGSPAHLDRQTDGTQSGSLTGGTRPHAHEFLDLFPDGVRVRFLVTPFQVRDDPLKGAVMGMPPGIPFKKEIYFSFSGPV